MRGGTPEGIPSQIFAIGGGDLVSRETHDFDQLIVSSSGRARPWTLCITGASSDSPEACNAFGNIYGDSLRCRTDYLRVLKGEPGGDDYRRKIARNEIFYFADGDLGTLMQTLNQFEILEDLQKAYRRGAVFCGVGAGAAALGVMGFAMGGIVTKGLGLEPVSIGTVAEGVTMSDSDTQAKFGELNGPGFVLGYMTTLHVINGEFRILTPNKQGRAQCVVNGHAREIESSVDFASLESLTSAQSSKVKQKA